MAANVANYNRTAEEAFILLASNKATSNQQNSIEIGAEQPAPKRSPSKASTSRRRRFFRCCVFFVLLSVIMLLLPVGIYFIVTSSLTPADSTTTFDFADADVNCSSSNQCLSYLSVARIFVNSSVDPCHNFYEYACGNFAKAYQLPTVVSWYQRSTIVENTAIKPVIEAIFQNNATKSPLKLWPVDEKAKRLYNSCYMDSELTKSRNNKRDMAKIVDEMGGLRLRINESRKTAPFGDSVVKLIRYNHAALFKLTFGPIKVVTYQKSIYQNAPWMNRKLQKINEKTVFGLSLEPFNSSLFGRLASSINLPVQADFLQLMHAYMLKQVVDESLPEEEQHLTSLNAIYEVIDFERSLAEIARSNNKKRSVRSVRFSSSEMEDDDDNFRLQSVSNEKSSNARIDWEGIRPTYKPNPFARSSHSERIDQPFPIPSSFLFGTSLSERIDQSFPDLSSFLFGSSQMENDDDNFRWESVSDLQSFCSRIDWKGFLTEMRNAAGLEPDAEISQVAMNHGGRTYLRKLCQLLGEKSANEYGRRVMQNYMVLKAIWPHTLEDMHATCVDEVASYLPLVVGSLYQRANSLKVGSIAKARAIAEEMRRSLVDELSQSKHLGVNTKNALGGKAKTSEIYIGLPDWTMQEAQLSNYYASFTVSDSQIGNKVQLHRFRLRQGMLLVRDGAKTLDTLLDISSLAQKAQYSKLTNNIVVLPGMFNEPFFNDAFPLSINFAGLGSAIAHELAHVFDNDEIENEVDGDLYLKKRQSCTSDYFGKAFTFDGVLKLRSAATAIDDMADIGGVGLAYRVYKKVMKNSQPTSYAEMEGLTDDQLFFLAYAQSQCVSYTAAGMNKYIAISDHTPNPFRVQGTVSNLLEFAKAYNCPVGSPMNPKEKCVMW